MNYLLIIIAIICLLSVILPKSKVLSVIIFAFMWILWGWNAWNGDYNAYELYFDNSALEELSFYEPNYLLLNKLVELLDGSFDSFMIFFSFMVLFLIYIFVAKSKYPALFSALYLLNFIMEYVFMRNYMANALFLVFLVVALSNSRYRQLYSIVLLLLAASFHVSSLLYMLFLLILCKKISEATLYLLSIISFLLVEVAFKNLLSSNELGGKMEYYMGDTTPVGPIIMHLLIVFSIILFLKVYPSMITSSLPKDREVINIFKRFNILSLVYIPTYIYIPYMTRFFRLLFPIDLFFILFLLYKTNTFSQKTTCLLILLACYAIVVYRFMNSSIKDTFSALIMFNKLFPL